MADRKPTDRKPNVIVFFTDQQRHDTTGVHGNPTTFTSNGKQYVVIVSSGVNAFTLE